MRSIHRDIMLDGKTISVELGKLAKQADGAAVVTCGGTSVLATVVASGDSFSDNFLPLTVDVEEKLYAAGKIPGSFFKREGRPTEGALLTARVIDRSIRPAFDRDFSNEVQVVITVLSTDQINPPDVLGLVGASIALSCSAIPFRGPIGGIRLGKKSTGFVINPTYEEMKECEINMIVAGNRDSLMMVEAGALEVTEEAIVEGLEFAQKKINELIDQLEKMVEEVRLERGEKKKDEVIGEISEFFRTRYGELYPALLRAMDSCDLDRVSEIYEKIGFVEKEALSVFPDDIRKVVRIVSRMVKNSIVRERLLSEIEPFAEEEMRKLLLDASIPGLTKSERSTLREESVEKLSRPFVERYSGLEPQIKNVFKEIERRLLRKQIMDLNLRPDGRKPFQIRRVSCEIGLLPKTHGSALFTRGETQVLTITTLGGYSEKQILDDLGIEEFKRFIHHYNFPPYCTGEVRPIRGPRRREIGHGALVERALLPVIPEEEEFPYTIRLVSEVLESNGSSSMASVCASSMSLMDAGVPLKNGSAVGGIAMGLVLEKGRHVILSDIQGLEDSIGDMDFKVAGTRKGVTALQMDIKCEGLRLEILKEALDQAREGRLFIMKVMDSAISEPRKEISPNAPRVVHLEIPVDKIGDLIGPGGKMIRAIIDSYDVEIDVENDGKVFVFGRDKNKVEDACEEIKRIVREPAVGDRLVGTVVKTTNFGAFIQLAPGRDGLIHISKLSKGRVDRVEDIVKVGDKVEVEIEGIDSLGRIDLKAVKLPQSKE